MTSFLTGAVGALAGPAFAYLDSVFSTSVKRSISWTATDAQGNQIQAIATNGQPAQSKLFPQVVVSEHGNDRLRITRNPVEQGSTISDHAFKEPAQIEIRAGWAFSAQPGYLSFLPPPFNTLSTPLPLITDSSFLSSLYKTLLQVQYFRAFVTVVTGKRVYKNMLMQSLLVTTNHETENVLMFSAVFEEILLAVTQIVSVPDASVMKTPQLNGATMNQGNTQLGFGSSANIGAMKFLDGFDIGTGALVN